MATRHDEQEMTVGVFGTLSANVEYFVCERVARCYWAPVSHAQMRGE